MAILKFKANDIIPIESSDNQAGVISDELSLGGSGKKITFFEGTAVVRSPIAGSILNSPGLAIGTSNKAKVKIVNTTYYLINGVLCSKASAEIVLAGTTVNAKFAVYQLTIKADGTVTVAKSADAASLAAMVFPAIPANEICLGFVIINPTGTGNFVGGTTELDDATVVPNAAYVNTFGDSNIINILRGYNLI